jgi:hypothetical protein
MSRLQLALLLAVAVSALSACAGGGDEPSKPEFEQAVVNTRDRVDFALSRITSATSKDEFFNRMDEAAVTIDDAAGDLADVATPEDFVDESGQLVDSLRQLAVDLDAFAHDARQPGGESLISGAAGLNFDSWDQANAALSALNKKGIEVELIQRH